MSTELNDLVFDPSQRRLCPDGSCVGVIGEDGKCSACGAVDPAGPPAEGSNSAAPPPAETPEPAPVPAETDGFDPNRRLCPDESCIGLLDENGRCKVCGRNA
jgi:hypothetical protein